MSAIGRHGGAVAAHEPQIGLLHEHGRLYVAAAAFAGHPRLGNTVQFVIDDMPKPLRSPGVAGINGGEERCNLALRTGHGENPKRPSKFGTGSESSHKKPQYTPVHSPTQTPSPRPAIT